MTIQYHLSPVTAAYDQYLPGVSEKAKYALWLRSASWDFEALNLNELLNSFAPLRGIVWFASAAVGDANNIDTNKAFEVWNGLTEKIVADSAMIFNSLYQRTVFSRVAWLAREAYTVLPGFLRRKSSEGQGVLSFIPPDTLAAVKWAKIVQGPGWLWLCREWIANSPHPSLEADAVALSYVDLTAEIEGTAGLLWEDSDVKTGLTFFGSEALLRPIAARLEGNACFVRDAGVSEKLFARGFRFEMCG